MSENSKTTEAALSNELQDMVFQQERNIKRERSDLHSVQRVIGELIKEGEILPSNSIAELSRIVATELKKIEDI